MAITVLHIALQANTHAALRRISGEIFASGPIHSSAGIESLSSHFRRDEQERATSGRPPNSTMSFHQSATGRETSLLARRSRLIVRKPIPAIPAYFVVRQTYLHTSVRMFTAESSSELLDEQLKHAEDSEWMLYATYLNTPKIQVRDRSQIHYGGPALDLKGDPIAALSGHYWTDRNTQGDKEAQKKIDAKCTGFEDALRRLP